MAVSPVARASEIQHDGAALLIPGLGDAGIPVGVPVFHHPSGLLDLVAAVTTQGAIMIPFRAKIIAAGTIVRAQAGTGPAEVYIGTIADPDAFALFTIATADAVGAVQEHTGVELLGSIVPAGTVVHFSANGGATSTGGVDVYFIYVPAAA